MLEKALTRSGLTLIVTENVTSSGGSKAN